MRITSKGQVTIPRQIRNRLGFLPETEVEFSVRGEAVILRKAKRQARGRGTRLIEGLRGTATRRLTTDQIMALTRGD
jgi:AbrB family looped-hinge helix DNA binding protein